jgi:threonine/homoserine/homoserine lactone efflux protein
MTISESLLAFTAAAAVLTATPGLDTALVLRTAAVEGARKGMLAAFGICLGTLVWGVTASAGLGVLFAASTFAYNMVRIAGAIYLTYLGIRLLYASFKESAQDAEDAASTGSAVNGTSDFGWFYRGLFTNLLNPKVGVFYVTFLPQFIPAGVNVFAFSTLLASIHVVQGILWFLMITQATQRFSRVLRKPAFRKTLDRLLGVVFLGFAFKLATERR